MKIRHLGLLALSACLAACSGGSGGTPGSTGGLHVLIDTSAGDALLEARVQGVILEDTAGNRGSWTLPGAPVVLLGHPAGTTSAFFVPGAAGGPWRAADLVLVPGTARAVRGEEPSRAVEVPGEIVHVLFTEPTRPGASWFALRHGSRPVFEDRNGKLVWRPNLIARRGDDLLLRSARARILSVDIGRALATAQLMTAGDLPIELHFPETATLILESSREPVSPRRFLGHLQQGSVIEFDGILGQRRVEVIAAYFDDEGDGNRGNKSRVEGTILEILHEEKAFRLRVSRIRINGAGLPDDRSLDLTVAAGDTKIKWSPRRGRHPGHLGFDALKRGMFVEVDWHGPAPDLRVTAHKIKIKADDRRSLLVEIVAKVREVDLADRILVLVSRSGGKLWIAGRSFESVEVQVTDDSVLVDRTPEGLQVIGLREIEKDDAVLVIAEHRPEERLQAVLVRVE